MVSMFALRRDRTIRGGATMRLHVGVIPLALALQFSFSGRSVRAQPEPEAPGIPAKYAAPTASYDYVRREVMIPMRDGVKLFTVIIVPKGAKNAPMILTRTPYNAAERITRQGRQASSSYP